MKRELNGANSKPNARKLTVPSSAVTRRTMYWLPRNESCQTLPGTVAVTVAAWPSRPTTLPADRNAASTEAGTVPASRAAALAAAAVLTANRNPVPPATMLATCCSVCSRHCASVSEVVGW